MRSSTPACFAAATVSPPPITVKPSAAPTAAATARVPASNGGFSKTPIGPFQNTVLAAAIGAAKRRRLSVPTSSAILPSGTPSSTVDLGRRLRLVDAVGDHHVDRQQHRDAARRRLLQQLRGERDLVGLVQRGADLLALRGEEGVGHAAAEHQLVDAASRLSMVSILPSILAPPITATKGFCGVVQQPRQRLDLLAPAAGPRPCATSRCGTPTTEAWARWAAPKASST